MFIINKDPINPRKDFFQMIVDDPEFNPFMVDNYPEFERHKNLVDSPTERIELLLPKYSKDQLDISADGKQLTVRGVVPKGEETKVTAERGGFRYKSFVKTFTLTAEPEKVEALLKNNVLTIVIKFSQPKNSKITIN